MMVLITGGAGFIGQHLARRLVGSGHTVVALDNLRDQVHMDPAASVARFPGDVVQGDVTDPAAWALIDRPDAVVHLAAETGTGQSMYEADHYRHVNVVGTQVAGQAARDWGVPLVAMSSRAVYGNGATTCGQHGDHFGTPCCDACVPAASKEDDPHHPLSVYGETKSEAERVLIGPAADVPVTILRPQNVVGPGQALHNPYTGVLAAFLARLREGRSLLVYGDGSATRDFIHVEDVAELIAWCLEHPPRAGAPRILNSGTGVRTTLDQMAEAAISGSPRAETEIEHVQVQRAGDIEHACADLARLTEVGAPTPRWTSRDAIADFIRASWTTPGATSEAWDSALDELASRGLVN
jgi:dTDP-L-rhamnose 4-epimerase